MDIRALKRDLRRAMVARILAMDPGERRQHESALIDRLPNLPGFPEAGTVLLYGLVLIISGGRPVGAPKDAAVMQVFGGAKWSELLWAIGVVVVLQVVLSGTRFGIHTQATGGNRVGAAESGIAINRIKVINFAIIGTLAGLAGILQGTRVGSYDPTNGGFDTMFMAVAAGGRPAPASRPAGVAKARPPPPPHRPRAAGAAARPACSA